MPDPIPPLARQSALTPDPRALIEARDAIQACIDMIEADGPKGGMWGQSFGYDLQHAAEKCRVALAQAVLR